MAWWHREWLRREWRQVALPTAGALGLSVLLAGPDWPLRYLALTLPQDNSATYNISFDASLFDALRMVGIISEPVTTGLRGLIAISVVLAVLRARSRLDAVGTAVVGSFLVMPYASSPGVVMTMVTAWPRLLERRQYLVAALAYLAQYPRPAAPGFGWGFSWVLVSVPLALTLGALLPHRVPLRSQGRIEGQ